MKAQEILSVLENNNLSNSEKANSILKALLHKQQNKIYSLIPVGETNAITCKEISDLIKIPTKNISSQIRQISGKTGAIKQVKFSNGLKYYRTI